MFIQIIRGPVRDRDLFHREAQRWPEELKPGATGYLGCTWGLGSDGVGVIAARFDSAAAAESTSGRPEQSAWWERMSKAFDDVTFHDCAEVDTMLGGGSDRAGFVQVIEGRAKDEPSAREMLRSAEGRLTEARPDLLGVVMAWHGDGGGFTQLVYFSSEADARVGERSEAENDTDDQYREMMAIEPTFTDLAKPRFD